MPRIIIATEDGSRSRAFMVPELDNESWERLCRWMIRSARFLEAEGLLAATEESPEIDEDPAFLRVIEELGLEKAGL